MNCEKCKHFTRDPFFEVKNSISRFDHTARVIDFLSINAVPVGYFQNRLFYQLVHRLLNNEIKNILNMCQMNKMTRFFCPSMLTTKIWITGITSDCFKILQCLTLQKREMKYMQKKHNWGILLETSDHIMSSIMSKASGQTLFMLDALLC